MMNMMFMTLMIFLVANLMMMLCLLLSKKSYFDREKLSPFECGFDQKSSSRVPFSLRFFLITLIFLIFDVEIAIIMPAIFNLEFSNLNSWMFTNSLFIMILIIGILHEWNQGSLEWSN
uniref:NADH-ubiquinone oxidoreductase chain 3 n=1 Tax=Notolachesilla sp. GRA1sp1LA TaxID=2597028 RepID=A0A8K1ZFH6_9NEOP|nr:NADH dehydrogenase subunit 3 [Notolachesilla sp. GRA1sp1LA]